MNGYLQSEYGFHSDTSASETQSASVQVDLFTEPEKINVSTQTDQPNLALVPYSKVMREDLYNYH